MANEIIDGLYNEGLLSPTDYKTAKTDLGFESDLGTGRWVDADTVELDDGLKIRLLGYDAKEIAKAGLGKQGEVGGFEQAAAVADLARNMGYTRLVAAPDPTGRYEDDFGRKFYELQNAAGSRLSDELTAGGVVAQGQYTTQAAQEAAPWEQLYQNSKGGGTDMAIAADWVREAIEEQGGDFAGFKQILFNEQELASVPNSQKKYVYDDAVQVRSRDRGYNNKAKNPLSTSWDTGWTGVLEGLSGTAELIGNQVGWEGLEDYAEGLKEGYQYDLTTAPAVIMDYKDVHGTGDFIEYVGNLAASSLPYMAVTIGSALTAPVTGGLSLSAPAAVYAGQVWNEMGDTDEGEKNAALAIGAGISMAVLDRLGIKGLANTSVLSQAGRQELIDLGIPEEQIVRATQIEAARLSGDAAKFAADRLKKQEILRDTLSRMLRQGTQESITEVAQETTSYLAAVAGSDKEYDPDELLNRITNAAIGGGLLGGGFAVPGQAVSTGKWADVAYRLAPAEENARTQQAHFADQEVAKYGRVRDHRDIRTETRARLVGKAPPEKAVDRASRAEKAKGKRTVTELRDDLWEGIPGLWRGSVRHLLPENIQNSSEGARKLASLFGGNLYRTFSGADYEATKNLKLGEYRGLMDVPYETVQDFGFKSPHPKNIQAMSDIIYDAYNLAQKDGDTVDWDSLEGTKFAEHIEALKKFDRSAKRLTRKLYEDQKGYNKELGYIDNYAYRHRSIDRVAVEKNQAGFKNDIMKQFNLDRKTADDLVSAILNVDSASDLEQAFAVIEKGGFSPGTHKQRTLNLSDNKEFADKWLNKDILANLSEMSKSAARYTTDQEFLGQDNILLDSLVDEIEQDLVAQKWDPEDAKAQADKIALGMKNYLDAHTGNYKRPKTQFGQRMQDVQKNFMFITTLASLPLATISSMVELALTAGGLEAGQIKQVIRNAKPEFKTMAQNLIWDKGDEGESIGRTIIRDLNYFDWETGAATRTGATEISWSRQQFTDVYFKTIGLSQFTDMTRALRASIAGDFFADKLDIIRTSDPRNPTNEYVEAVDALRNHGINVEDFVQITAIPEDQRSPEDQQKLRETLRNATYEFINNAVVLPGTANRPLFYNDPRFALFTQFHGFISAFQGHVLPKLYRQAFKGQTPSMKYNAFAVMMTMIMLGFLSQYIKDLIKYGQPTPYLEDRIDLIQRGVGSSGLLGVSERGLNFFHPIYESRHDNVGEWAFDTIAGESAAATKLRQLGDAGVDAVSGDLENATRKGLKFVPYVGPLTEVRNRSAEWAFGEE